MSENTFCAGRRAYERETELFPYYPSGVRRPYWHELSEVARWSWDRNPTDRYVTSPPSSDQGAKTG